MSIAHFRFLGGLQDVEGNFEVTNPLWKAAASCHLLKGEVQDVLLVEPAEPLEEKVILVVVLLVSRNISQSLFLGT